MSSRKLILLAAVVLGAVLALVVHDWSDAGAEVPTSITAHHGEAHSEGCDGVFAVFVSFPNGANPITATADNGHHLTRTFHGPSGSFPQTPWSDFGINPELGGVHSIVYSWSVDGGSSYGPFSVNLDKCVPPPTTSTSTTSTTVPPTSTTSTAPPPPDNPPVSVGEPQVLQCDSNPAVVCTEAVFAG